MSKLLLRVLGIGIGLIWLGFIVVHNSRSQTVALTDILDLPFDVQVNLLSTSNVVDDTFLWKEYIELNPDLAGGLTNETLALKHYMIFGKNEKRLTRVVPDDVSWQATLFSIRNKLRSFDRVDIAKKNRNLVIFHVGKANSNNSMDVFVNNVKIFADSIVKHGNKAEQQAFYLFNVIGGDHNPLIKFIPNRKNVAIVKWTHASSDMRTHIRTIKLLGNEIVSQFEALVFLNQGVRGPLVLRDNGEWLVEYRRLLDNNNVGLVGSTISCEQTPHVQTHMFAMQSSLFGKIIDIIDSGPSATTWLGIIAQFEVGLSTTILQQGYNISALLYDHRLNSPAFDGKCIPQPRVGNDWMNPTSWCDLKSEEVIFMKWGGEPLRTNGYLCQGAIEYMSKELEQLNVLSPDINLVVPETLVGGKLYGLYQEYTNEMYVDKLNSKLTLSINKKKSNQHSAHTVSVNSDNTHNVRKSSHNKKVCFLVRTYDTRPSFEKSTSINYDLPGLIHSLLKQTSIHWTATFFNTDHQSSYDAELQQIVARYRDDRLKYMSIPSSSRPKFTATDAGYTATDYVLSQMNRHPECAWISITNGDNIYGSEVVDRVLNVKSVGFGSQSAPPDMILNPLDSRNFADQDYVYRNEVKDWDKRCEGIQAMLNFNRLAYTAQPVPMVGAVDLAAMFLSSEKFVKENLFFGNFTNPKEYPCAGCQDGYFTEYLVRNRLWTYTRLPIDGLKSIIFHGPSPTWCIASGNVWFDHPVVSKVGCFLHSTVRSIQDDPASHSLYDWDHHYGWDRLCLRLNKKGYNKVMGRSEVEMTSVVAAAGRVPLYHNVSK